MNEASSFLESIRHVWEYTSSTLMLMMGWFGGICLFNTCFCMKDHFVTMVLIQKIKLNLKYMKISFVWLLFIPALSHQMFPVLIKLLWVSALLRESLVRGERLSSYRPRVGYKQNVELRAATPSTWLLLVLSQSHWSVLKKNTKKVLTVCQRFAEQRHIYWLRALFVEGAAIFHHSFIINKHFRSQFRPWDAARSKSDQSADRCI